jgi:hypothetical protein
VRPVIAASCPPAGTPKPAHVSRTQIASAPTTHVRLVPADMQAELDAIEEQEKVIERRQERLHKAMLAAVRRGPVEQLSVTYSGYQHSEVANAIDRRQTVCEDELLAEDPQGQEILRQRQEKENLLDTVWLATSGQRIKELWKKVVDLLGDEQTQLQKEALALAPKSEEG